MYSSQRIILFVYISVLNGLRLWKPKENSKSKNTPLVVQLTILEMLIWVSYFVSGLKKYSISGAITYFSDANLGNLLLFLICKARLVRISSSENQAKTYCSPHKRYTLYIPCMGFEGEYVHRLHVYYSLTHSHSRVPLEVSSATFILLEITWE